MQRGCKLELLPQVAYHTQCTEAIREKNCGITRQWKEKLREKRSSVGSPKGTPWRGRVCVRGKTAAQPHRGRTTTVLWMSLASVTYCTWIWCGFYVSFRGYLRSKLDYFCGHGKYLLLSQLLCRLLTGPIRSILSRNPITSFMPHTSPKVWDPYYLRPRLPEVSRQLLAQEKWGLEWRIPPPSLQDHLLSSHFPYGAAFLLASPSHTASSFPSLRPRLIDLCMRSPT
jgi:hypothetical protein